MTIRIYPSLLPDQAVETHRHVRTTLGAWLDSQGVEWRGRDEQPVVAMRAGEILPVEEWDSAVIDPEDDVALRIIPHGGLFKAIGGIIGKIFNLAFGWLLPRTRASGRSETPDGSRLESTAATANTAKLGAVVPELVGRFRRYPDYLTPPRRYFTNRREQWLEFLCCIGPGEYSFNYADVLIGDTPITSLGSNAEVVAFGPGNDVSGHSAHEHWYSVDEVGGTASGTAGLELSADPSTDINPTIPSYDVLRGQLDALSGEFPSGWGVGTVIDITIFRVYEFERVEQDDVFYRIHGNFLEIQPGIGTQIDMVLENGNVVAYTVIDRDVDGSGDGWIQLNDETGFSEGNRTISFKRHDRWYRITLSQSTRIQVAAVLNDVVVPGWPGFGAYTGPVSISVDASTVYGEWAGPFRAAPAAEATDTAELDFFLSTGLSYISGDGGLESRSVSVEVQYRESDSTGGYTSQTLTYQDRTMDQIGFTERFTFPPMNPEFRVRRKGARETSTQVNDTIQWYGLRTRLPTRGSYPNWTTMAVRILSGGKLGAQSENQINLVATRVLPTLQPDGAWGPAIPTRDISAAVKHILTTIGYTDDNINMSELQRLHDVWVARGETVDYIYDETTVRQAIGLAFAAGMADMSVEDGLVTPVRDDVRTTFESGQGYSPQNMTGTLRRTFSAPKPDDHDGVEVEFISSETWTSEVVKCLLPGDQGFKLEKIKLDGVTDRTRAWRIGMRRRRAMVYRRWNHAFSTELDALNSRYLSYVPLFDDTPGYGQSMILTSISNLGGSALLRVSEPLVWEEGEEHVVGYRRPDGTVAGPFAASPGPDEYSVLASIPAPWPVVTLKHEPPHVYFGTTTRWCYPALIEEIKPNGNETVSVTASNYDVRVYADDDNAPD